MVEFVNQIFGLLTVPPGNLAYHIVLASTVVGALQSSLNHWMRSGFPQGNRMVRGLSLLLIFQLVRFAFSGLIWLGVADPDVWLAPVDRFVVLVSILVIVWLWLLPESLQLADAVFSFIFVLAAGLFTLSMVWLQGQPAQEYFNATWPDWGSAVFAMVLLGLGMVGLLLRRPNGWGIGWITFLLLFCGQLLQFLFPQAASDYAGPVRLAELMAYPWLLTLPQRFPLDVSGIEKKSQLTIAERRRFNSDPQSVLDFIQLLNQPADDQYCINITRLISKLMLADFCLLVTPPTDDNSIIAVCGYNLIQERVVEGFSIDGDKAQMIVSALKLGKPLRLPASSTSSDLKAISKGIGMARVGHLLVVPVARPGQPPLMGLTLLSPFSKRGWSREDQTILLNYAAFLPDVILRNQSGDETIDERNLDDLEQLRAALHAAETSKQQIIEQFEALKLQAAQDRARAENLAVLVSSHDETVISSSKSQSDQGQETFVEAEVVPKRLYEDIQANLRLALEQLVELRAEREGSGPSRSSSRLQPLDLSTPELGRRSKTASENVDEIAETVQDLRQPMSSILGYTDLLLGESIGILGAQQKRYLERIRTSIERLGGLTDDLIQMTTWDDNGIKRNPQVIDLGQVIDELAASQSGQLSEKNINLVLEIDQGLPQLHIDVQVLQDIIDGLLRNAIQSSPQNSEIHIRTSVEANEHEAGYVLIQVADSGPGLSADDLPKVFSKLYQTDPDGIDSQGQERVDLAAVKALVEAHGGRIWIDSALGLGSTFSTLLPVTAVLGKD